MKTILSLSLALLAISAAQAQIFRPQPVNGSVLPRHAQASERRDVDHRDRSPSVSHRSGGRHDGYRQSDYGRGHFGPLRSYDRHQHGHAGFSYGARLGYGYYPSYGYFPRYSHVPSYGYYTGYGDAYPYYDSYGYYGSRSAATNGLLLGALAGGIIGHNSGDLRHSAWRGSAWGAGLGWLLGSVVDANRRPVAYAPAAVAVQPAPTMQVQAQSATATQPQQVTIINNYYNSSSPMTAANGMFGR